jgi:phosphoglycolate phosphatase
LHGVTVVFDLDGTVADTSGDLITATNYALASEGFPAAPEAAIKPGVGYGTRAMLRAALKASAASGVLEETMARMAARLVDYYSDHIAERTTLFPGFLACVEVLKADGALIALCTNKRESLARKLCKALNIDNLFDALAGGDSFPVHKPHPGHIIRVIEQAGGRPGLGVMVGDSEADVAAAMAAHIPCVAVRFGYAAVSAEALGANATIGHFQELPALVRTYMSVAKPL